MPEQLTPETAEQQLQEQFSMSQEQQLLALSLRHNLRQLHSTERIISDLQAVMAGETSVSTLLEEYRYLLAISKVAVCKALHKNKRTNAWPASVCDDMLAELEEIDNDETE